jgi:hypothetical protein
MAQTAGVVLDAQQHGARPVDEHASQVGVPALADAEKSGFGTSGMLARYQAEPGGEVASIAEGRSIADGSYHRSRNQRPHSRNLTQSPARLVFVRYVLNLFADVGDVGLELLLFLPEIGAACASVA